MKKLKEVWNDLKNWQKGGLIGLIFGILINFYVYFISGNYISTKLNFIQGIPLIFHTSLFNISPDEVSKINIVFVFIWYIILGLLLGLIYQYIKSKFKEKANFYFALAFFVFVILIMLLNFLTIVFVFSGFS